MAGEERLCSETLLYDNGIIWFTDIADNKLYQYNLAEKSTFLFYVFEDEKSGQERLFSRIEKRNNLLFCIPFSADALYIIDITSKAVKRKKIMEPELRGYEDYVADSKFASSAWYQDSLFLIGAAYPAIVQYEMLTDTLSYHTEWFTELREHFKAGKDFIFRRTCVAENRIFAPCCRSNCVMEFNMGNGKFEIHELDTAVNGFTAICRNKDKFWLIPRRDEKVICWDKDNHMVEEYIFFKNKEKSINFYNDILEEDENHIILLAGRAGTTCRLNTEKMVMEKMSRRLWDVGAVFFAGKKKDTVYAFGRYSKVLILIKKDKAFFRRIYNPQCGDGVNGMDRSSIRYEDRFDSLEDLIDELREK